MDPRNHQRTNLALAAGAALSAITGGLALWAGLDTKASATAAITMLCAVYWILEPIPLAATSLIPFAAFPLAGVLDHGAVAAAYGHTMILLLLGGFMLSAAVEKSGAHRRIAFKLVAMAGKSERRLVLGFMLASALCSMWISNAATTLMLLPVAMAAIEGREGALRDRLAPPLLLGVAYAASIGGMATPVGTPPNIIFMGAYEKATGVELSFLEWMKIGLPVSVALIPIAWWWLTRRLPRGAASPAQLPPLAPINQREIRVLIVFGLTALGWIFRAAPAGGWSALAGIETAGDSTVALAAVLVLFVVPDGTGEGRLLDWPTARTIPWGLLILFGGGIAIADAFAASGLSTAVGGALSELANQNPVVVIAVIALVVTFMTEVTSNTATTTLLMPILAAAAIAAALEPRLLMIPAALSASCAFMLPVATAPNAIVFGTDHVRTTDMARAGFALNLFGAVVITALCALLLGLA